MSVVGCQHTVTHRMRETTLAQHKLESLVTGTVWKIERRIGDSVAEGETILIVESMKMEIPIEAPAYFSWSN